MSSCGLDNANLIGAKNLCERGLSLWECLLARLAVLQEVWPEEGGFHYEKCTARRPAPCIAGDGRPSLHTAAAACECPCKTAAALEDGNRSSRCT